LLYCCVGAGLALASTGANAAWYEAKTAHFLILADESPRDLQEFAVKLEKFDKAVRSVRAMDDPPLGDAGRVTIFVLRDNDAVSRMAVGKASPIYGFYIPRAAGSVAFVPRKTDGQMVWDLNADTVFFHEYAHHLQLQNTDAALPPWLVEGFAEFFSSAEFPRDGSVKIGTPANHRAPGLYLSVKVRIEDLLGEGLKKNASAEEMDVFYGRAWLLTHYLTFNDQRRGQLANYARGIESGKDLLTAARDAFGDLKQLDRDLDRYLNANRFKYLAVNGEVFKGITAAVRALGPGEAAIMPVRIRSARGVDSKTAPEVAAQARSIAASYPDDPAVQRALAEAEFDEQNYSAAEAAADRALAKNPSLAKAMIYKGRAEMQEAEGHPKADWNAIRHYFITANKLDTEDPEPLMLYYETFARQGKQPPADAISGLQYALVLAPQDQSLRAMVVTQLIADNHLAEARDILAPLAFNPHSSEGRERARKIMEALAANNQKAALAAMNAGEGK
jgi:tetratricopeptide (TPR) repeat protein